MATFRSVHTKIWCKRWFEESPPDAKLVFLYLLTTGHRNESGLFEITVKRIADDTGLSIEEATDAMTHLCEKKKILYDSDASVVWIVNAIGYNKVNAKTRQSILTDYGHCNCVRLREAFVEKHGAFLKMSKQQSEFKRYQPVNILKEGDVR